MQRFEPDQLVLVREKRETVWRLTHYSHRIQGDKRWSVTIDGKVWEPHQIIPYTGNEHFLGTTDSPKPKWEPKPGELVAVRDSENEEWKARVFLRRDSDNGLFECGSEIGRAITTRWKLCEPIRKNFNVPD